MKSAFCELFVCLLFYAHNAHCPLSNLRTRTLASRCLGLLYVWFLEQVRSLKQGNTKGTEKRQLPGCLVADPGTKQRLPRMHSTECVTCDVHNTSTTLFSSETCFFKGCCHGTVLYCILCTVHVWKSFSLCVWVCYWTVGGWRFSVSLLFPCFILHTLHQEQHV